MWTIISLISSLTFAGVVISAHIENFNELGGDSGHTIEVMRDTDGYFQHQARKRDADSQETPREPIGDDESVLLLDKDERNDDETGLLRESGKSDDGLFVDTSPLDEDADTPEDDYEEYGGTKQRRRRAAP